MIAIVENYLLLRFLVPWIKHAPSVCKSAVGNQNFKQQLVCKFDIMCDMVVTPVVELVMHSWTRITFVTSVSVMCLSYRKTSSISRTKFQNLNVSCIIMQLSSFNSLKPGVKLIMKMLLEQRRQAMLQLHLSYQQFYRLLRCDLY